MDASQRDGGTAGRNAGRQGERRKGDRRRRPSAPATTRPADESWFGVLGVAADTQMRLDEAAGVE
ncbi:MAG TPA: hypothetical protein PLO41_24925, partial [Rubrivivax sp.]|nr:hypothetical protein [Rubrivivax sp.]